MATEQGCTTYTTRWVEIPFTGDTVCCARCPLLETYARKQCRRSGEYILDEGQDEPEWRPELYREKAALVPVFYQYVQENAATGYATSYSEWQAARR